MFILPDFIVVKAFCMIFRGLSRADQFDLIKDFFAVFGGKDLREKELS